MQRFLRALLAAAALGGALAAPAAAKVAPCEGAASGTTCDVWSGKVTFIGDGDTLSVDVAGDGTKKPKRVRITGINATEEIVHTNRAEDRKDAECHANEATDRLERLVKRSKNRVRLYAQNPDSTSRGRWRRAVAVKLSGRWHDVGRVMVKEGLALWLSSSDEWAWNAKYSVLQEYAKAAQVGMWDPAYCLPGPEEQANVRLWANADGPGSDRRNPNGEWIKIKNLDPENQLFLGGWRVRDSGLRGYVFPPEMYLAPGQTVTVFVGPGTDGDPPGAFYWGLSKGIFNNPDDELSTGDGAFLLDPDGDIRASMLYPCRRNCTDPYQGSLAVRADYKGKEHVTVRNVGQGVVDLEGYRLWSRPHQYDFGPGSLLQPGQSMRVDVEGDPATDEPLHRHWGLEHPILGAGGDKVSVQTFSYIDVACTAWGSASC